VDPRGPGVDLADTSDGPALDPAWTWPAGEGICRPAAGVPGCSLPRIGATRGPPPIPPLTWPDAEPGPSQVHRRSIPGPPQVHPGSMPSKTPGSRRKNLCPTRMILGSRAVTRLSRGGQVPGVGTSAGPPSGTGATPRPGTADCRAAPSWRQAASARARQAGPITAVAARCHRVQPGPDATAAARWLVVTLVRAHRVAATGWGHGSKRRHHCADQASGVLPKRACAAVRSAHLSRRGPVRRHGEAVSCCQGQLV
jgi:hypothetical protein